MSVALLHPICRCRLGYEIEILLPYRAAHSKVSRHKSLRSEDGDKVIHYRIVVINNKWHVQRFL
jgi:hypothetical protein